jgi:hypothetical protein
MREPRCENRESRAEMRDEQTVKRSLTSRFSKTILTNINNWQGFCFVMKKQFI